MFNKLAKRRRQADSKQQELEALVSLATFFYKMDGRISLAEQNYVEQLMHSLDWESSISVETFQNILIPQVQKVIDEGDEACIDFLSQQLEQIISAEGQAQAQRIAKEMQAIDDKPATNAWRYWAQVCPQDTIDE